TLEPARRGDMLAPADVEAGQRVERRDARFDLDDLPVRLDGALGVPERPGSDLGEALVERSGRGTRDGVGLHREELGHLVVAAVAAKDRVERLDGRKVPGRVREVFAEGLDSPALPLDAIDEACEIEPELDAAISIDARSDLALTELKELGQA